MCDKYGSIIKVKSQYSIGNSMKTKIVTLIIALFILSCRQTKIQVTKEAKKPPIAAENKTDSIRLDIALKDAFKTAETALKTDEFTKQYELQPDDSSYVIKIDILIGTLFKDDKKYFLLRRHVPQATYLDLYKVNEAKIEKLIERKQDGMTYISDTILDVNGDGYKDFLVHWYPSSGCCRRNIYNIYLNQPTTENFTQDYEFINPTFSSSEKIIRGVAYGHPGEVGLYKYKWNGQKVDTLEYIYPNPDAKINRSYIKTKHPLYSKGPIKKTRLKNLPKEYRTIEDFEWFDGY